MGLNRVPARSGSLLVCTVATWESCLISRVDYACNMEQAHTTLLLTYEGASLKYTKFSRSSWEYGIVAYMKQFKPLRINGVNASLSEHDIGAIASHPRVEDGPRFRAEMKAQEDVSF